MTDSQKWLILVTILFGGWLIYQLSPVLMPFAFSAILAYLGDPLTDKLETYRLTRTQSVLVVFLVMFFILLLALLLLIPQLNFQISDFIQNLPAYADRINYELLPWLHDRFGLTVNAVNIHELIQIIQTNWEKAGGLASNMLSSISRSGGLVISMIANMLLIPVVTFYLLRDWDDLVAKIHDSLPRRVAPVVGRLAKEVDSVLSAFLRGQFYVMLALGVIYSVGLTLVGLNSALLIGMLAGLISFVPYLGGIVGFSAACIAAIVQFHESTSLIYVGLVFLIGQTLEGTLLTPNLVGDKIGLHPVAVIFSVMAGGQLFGFLGVLLALPAASVIMVLLRHLHDIYRDSQFYGTE